MDGACPRHHSQWCSWAWTMIHKRARRGGGEEGRGRRGEGRRERIACKLNGTRTVKRDEESGGILVPIAR